MTTIEDVFDLIRNGVSIKQHPEKSGFPITRIETISNRVVDRTRMGYAGITDISKYKDYILQDEDILMSHINSIQHLGKAAIYKKIGNEKIIHGMNLLCLRPKKDKIHSSFALYYFLSDDFHRKIASITKPSVNQASFTISALKKLSFPSFSISEQQKIASKFDAIGQIIVLRKQQLSKLDQLVKSRFVEMFGDPKQNPKKYLKEKLELHAYTMTGYPFKSEKYSTQGIKIVGGYNLMQGYILWDNCKYWPNEKGYENYLLKDNDIVIAMDRPWVSDGLKIAKINNNLPALLIQRTAYIRCKDINKDFLYELLDSKYFFNHCNITGSLVPHISISDINNYQIIIPPIDEQNSFSKFIQIVNKSKLNIKQSLETLETLKKSLMQEYFG